MIELGSNEGINRLSGYSNDNYGMTYSLKATTTTGRTWGPHGDHKPDNRTRFHLKIPKEMRTNSLTRLRSLRSSPDADNLILRFISGDQTTDKIILRCLHFRQRKDIL